MNRNKLVVPGSRQAMDKLKFEIANELGINMGANQTARLNGTVGGQMTKRLVEIGEKQLAGQNQNFQK